VAKSQAARAAGVNDRTAHQVHGAIGFTLDHQLRHYPLRMQAWRSEFGDERHWERRVGEITLAAGAPDVWPLLTSGRLIPSRARGHPGRPRPLTIRNSSDLPSRPHARSR
jgi:alkylation response protein AidB-like acyl-CoA dehydrogenase